MKNYQGKKKKDSPPSQFLQMWYSLVSEGLLGPNNAQHQTATKPKQLSNGLTN